MRNERKKMHALWLKCGCMPGIVLLIRASVRCIHCTTCCCMITRGLWAICVEQVSTYYGQGKMQVLEECCCVPGSKYHVILDNKNRGFESHRLILFFLFRVGVADFNSRMLF